MWNVILVILLILYFSCNAFIVGGVYGQEKTDHKSNFEPMTTGELLIFSGILYCFGVFILSFTWLVCKIKSSK